MAQTKNTSNTGEKEKKFKIGLIAVLGTVVVIIAVVLAFAFGNKKDETVIYTILLESSEGFSIEVDNSQMVRSVTPSTDLSFAPDYASFEGKSLKETVESLTAALTENNLLSKKKNALLVSVYGSDTLSNLAAVTDIITDLYLNYETIDLAVIGQPIDNLENEKARAEANGISLGKQMLIDRILNQNKQFTFDELKGLGLEELSLIGHFVVNNITYVYQLGAVYQSGYIAMATAQTKALYDCGATFSTVANLLTDIGVYEDNLVYEIDFDYDGFKYEYIINASNAEILNCSKDSDEEYEYQKEHVSEEPTEASGYIGATRAKTTLFESVGLTEDKVTELTVSLKHAHGLVIYVVEFEYEDYAYEAFLNAQTGDLVEYTKKYNG